MIHDGDEIGMGDNLYLGDRDVVRTPMQWNDQRNAGFSLANPGYLYLPTIMDHIYGYQSVNVEAQLSNPSSFLHWLKRMIAIRKNYTAFGRGDLSFLEPGNRKILADIRRWKEQIILCVANLSGSAQPVEMDLSAFSGMTPTESVGRSEFPPIG